MKLSARLLLISICVVASAASVMAQTSDDLVGTQVNRRMPEAGIAAGKFMQYVIFDSTYRRPRRIWVYTPPGYRERGTPHDLLMVFDGEDYFNAIPLPYILDTLIAAGKAPPFVAVFVDDSIGQARVNDLSNSSKFAGFIGRQLIPWVRKNWNVTRKADRSIVAGFSNGGLGASYIAFRRPDLFGNVYSQSGAFWRGNEGGSTPPEWLTSQYASDKKRDIRFVLDVGDQETAKVLGGTGPVFIETNRRFRDALLSKGYSVTYTEVPNGVHSEATWAPRFPIGLVTLTQNWR
jgi:enterochelin esterase family protein